MLIDFLSLRLMNKIKQPWLFLLIIPACFLTFRCNSKKMKEINSVSDFYQLIKITEHVDDNYTRCKLITEQLSHFSQHSIVNFEKYLRKELIRVCHYNTVLLFELNYPSPIFTKNGTPVELPGEPYISTDGYIYFRCGIILLGEETVNFLLEDPNYIMQIKPANVEIDAEGLLYCAADAMKNKGLKIDISDSLDMSEHYDHGNYSISGKKIKWYSPQEEYPELVKFYNYMRPVTELQ